MDHELVISARFCGPPGSANGGYVCGRLSAFVAGPSRVRLHRPPPLDTPLQVKVGAESAELFAGELLVASAQAVDLPRDAPAAPPLEVARSASTRYVGFAQHPFPRCFVCGPQRTVGDGLCIFPGSASEQLVAAPFVPDESLLDPHGHLLREHVWAALDCPGYFACVGAQPVTMLLGELAVVQLADVPGDRPLVAYAWPLEREGRKARCGSALATAEGVLLASARATWIGAR
jgi:hypothetical protein